MRINETATLSSDMSYGQYQESMNNMTVSVVEESKDVTPQPAKESEETQEVANVSISEESLSLVNKMKDDATEMNKNPEKKETIKVGEFIGSIDIVYDENTKNIGAQEPYLGPTMIDNKRVNFMI